MRTSAGIDDAGVLSVVGTEATAPGHGTLWEVTVTHTDGRRWHVTVAQSASLPPRPESCGAALGTPARMDVLAVDEIAPAVTGPLGASG